MEYNIIKIYGYSDDLIEVESSLNYVKTIDFTEENQDAYGYTIMEGTNVGGEYNISNNRALFVVSGKLVIGAKYGINQTATWGFEISMTEEGECPNWPIAVSAHPNGYSMQIEISIPTDEVSRPEVLRVK